MNRRLWLGSVVLAFVASLAGGFGCSSETSVANSGGQGGSSAGQTTGSDTSSASGTGGDLFGDGGDNAVVSIAIEPANPLLVVANGLLPPPVSFKAVATTANGNTLDVNGAWAFDRFDIASIDSGSGVLTASGLLGGQGTVTVTVGALTASTTVTVKLELTSDPEAIDPAIKALFPAASQDDPLLSLVYPYDRTVFPRGLAGPTIQWNGGGAADVYRVYATSPTFEYEAWATVPPASRYDFPKFPVDVWRKLTDSTVGDIQIDIQRYDGATAYLAKTQVWTIAPANLAGTIYYWEVNNGNVVRIKPGDTAPESFIQKPDGVTCVACHSVSKDGSRIVASFHGGASPWGTFNAADGASLYSAGTPSGFQAISPNGSHVLWRHWNDGAFNSTGYLSLSTFDSNVELAQLVIAGGAPSHPAWSGDAGKIAFSVRSDGNGLDFTQSSLWITDVDLLGNAFANTAKIVDAEATRPTVTFPTFSPDSKWIAFERATQARSRGAQSEIWLTNLDGTIQTPLGQTNGAGVLQGEQASASYEPTFNPVSVGGYFWLVVVSERVYGNTLEDTNPGTRRKQLWVSAIDANPVAGQDPSHPAFWLPGQGLDNNNMRGEWALSPCKQIGEGCSAGFECCDGFCHAEAGEAPECSNDPGGGCSQIGEACVSAADCCDPGAQCTGGYCAPDVPR